VGVVVGYHLREPDEQTTHAVTHRKARDNSGLTWVSWVRWSGKWRAREAALPMPCVNSSHPWAISVA